MIKNKTKILTIIGTRPEIIRLSRIIPKIDKKFRNILVHTGQNFDFELDKIFLKEFKIRKPNYYLNARGSFSEQISIIINKIEKIIIKEKPSKFLVLGDTNSSIGSIVAQRLGLKVFHMEAGNRCYSNKSPEEINRKIIDHSSNILLPYTTGSKRNLIREGISKKNIIVIGNPITEVIFFNKSKINNSKILDKFSLKKNEFFLLTLHRQENVDNILRFKKFLNILNKIVKIHNKKLVWPIHPRSKLMLNKLNYKLNEKIILIKPLGFFDFIKLESSSFIVLTDSGTVQEECSILKKPCLIVREYTERPETILAGGSYLTGFKEKNILNKINYIKKNKLKISKIKDYSSIQISSKVLRILLKK